MYDLDTPLSPKFGELRDLLISIDVVKLTPSVPTLLNRVIVAGRD